MTAARSVRPSGQIPLLRANDMRGVGARLRSKLRHAAGENFGRVQVAILVGCELMGAAELPRSDASSDLGASGAPAVQVVPIQIVLEDSVRSPVAYPDVLVRRDEVVVGRRVDARRPHLEELAVLVEDLHP